MDSIELLKALININSSTVEKANEAVEFAASYLKDNGIYGKIIEKKGHKSFISTIGSGNKTIILNGHLDVVSGKPYQFESYEENGCVYGRGSADMKAGCAAMMNAFISLKDEALPCKVMLQLVSDEETGGFSCSNYLVDQGYVGDFVICAEPTNLKLAIQSNGILEAIIESYGISAHGSRPWEGENAILKAIENYNRVIKLPILNIGSEFYEKSSVNLAKIEGGDAFNKVPDKSTMVLDIRFLPSLDYNNIKTEIKKVVDGKVIFNQFGEGISVSPEDSYVRKLTDSIENILGKGMGKLVGQYGSADTRFFSEKGIPAVEFGPIGDNWHGDNEYVEIQSVYDLEKILVHFIKNLEK